MHIYTVKKSTKNFYPFRFLIVGEKFFVRDTPEQTGYKAISAAVSIANKRLQPIRFAIKHGTYGGIKGAFVERIN